jgi:probable DNA metabolism protein
VKRKFGLYYDLSKTEIVEIDFSDFAGDENTAKEIFDPSEEQYQQLWKIYFKNVNIPSRRNMRLHLRHVPRRYWKYLTEKQ